LSYRLTELLKAYKDHLSGYEESKRIFLNGGKYYQEGDVFKQPELAATLTRLQKSGAKDFYEGETAKMIADDMKAHNGLITLDDLKAFKRIGALLLMASKPDVRNPAPGYTIY